MSEESISDPGMASQDTYQITAKGKLEANWAMSAHLGQREIYRYCNQK